MKCRSLKETHRKNPSLSKTNAHRVAFFISPHGYGHAARAAAVMEALRRMERGIRFEIFTRVPRWFFKDSLSSGLRYHCLSTDIGLVQKGPLHADLDETLAQLDRFFPFDSSLIRALAGKVKRLGLEMVLCDIAPLGIAVAREAGIPSVLIENFTWDWIYQGYVSGHRGFAGHIAYVNGLFRAADYHVQTEPVCQRRSPDIITSPVSRRARTPAQTTRKRLGVSKGTKIVLVTMGGIPEKYSFLERMQDLRGVCFVVPGAYRRPKAKGNLILLPHHSDFYHPDLVHASDGVIGKVGYSTLAEVYEAGIPFGYIAREDFRESESLVSYIKKEMHGLPLREEEFHDGTWLRHLPALLARPVIRRTSPLGADQVAHFVCSLLS